MESWVYKYKFSFPEQCAVHHTKGTYWKDLKNLPNLILLTLTLKQLCTYECVAEISIQWYTFM